MRTKEIKEKLMKKAIKIRRELTSKISQMASDKVDDIQKKYDALNTVITKKIQDEETLVEVQKIVENHEQQIEIYEKEESEVAEYINLLTKYGFSYEENKVIRFWFLKVMPSEIKNSIRSQANKLVKRERELLDQLNTDKGEFFKTLQGLQERFDDICAISSFS